jgi:hypothetical protein
LSGIDKIDKGRRRKAEIPCRREFPSVALPDTDPQGPALNLCAGWYMAALPGRLKQKKRHSDQDKHDHHERGSHEPGKSDPGSAVSVEFRICQ